MRSEKLYTPHTHGHTFLVYCFLHLKKKEMWVLKDFFFFEGTLASRCGPRWIFLPNKQQVRKLIRRIHARWTDCGAAGFWDTINTLLYGLQCLYSNLSSFIKHLVGCTMWNSNLVFLINLFLVLPPKTIIEVLCLCIVITEISNIL